MANSTIFGISRKLFSERCKVSKYFTFIKLSVLMTVSEQWLISSFLKLGNMARSKRTAISVEESPSSSKFGVLLK